MYWLDVPQLQLQSGWFSVLVVFRCCSRLMFWMSSPFFLSLTCVAVAVEPPAYPDVFIDFPPCGRLVTFISCIIERSLILKKIGLNLKKMDLQRLHNFGRMNLFGYFYFSFRRLLKHSKTPTVCTTECQAFILESIKSECLS